MGPSGRGEIMAVWSPPALRILSLRRICISVVAGEPPVQAQRQIAARKLLLSNTRRPPCSRCQPVLQPLS
jgi:hypothetical protein